MSPGLASLVLPTPVKSTMYLQRHVEDGRLLPACRAGSEVQQAGQGNIAALSCSAPGLIGNRCCRSQLVATAQLMSRTYIQ